MQRWTDEQLVAAVGQSRNLSQTLEILGLRQAGGNYDTIRRRIQELDLNISHWPRPSLWTATREALEAAVAGSQSVAGALRCLGWPLTNGSRRRFRALVELYGADTSHFLGSASQRGRRFPERARPTAVYLVRGGPRRAARCHWSSITSTAIATTTG